ncbi:hypothetical protein [Rhizobium mongolense]|uniref:Secreted protein n=2 Tax=Rhizobium mongolense TaxID=57676 RepID=A0ABR6IKV0_9HYPH|nr:hypothetical protein [Rhizobium mongolense]MBB4228365.1 hypothetical protein [Rhizobium mongolense]TVZ64486.1 hypothetical protein BCL32_4740 [Rhizobium mongolense USDA 1844]
MRIKLLAASILALGMATSASYAQSQGAPAGSTNSPPSVQEGEDYPFGDNGNAPTAVDPNVTGSTTMTRGGSMESNCSAYDKARTSPGRGDDQTDMAELCGNK